MTRRIMGTFLFIFQFDYMVLEEHFHFYYIVIILEYIFRLPGKRILLLAKVSTILMPLHSRLTGYILGR